MASEAAVQLDLHQPDKDRIVHAGFLGLILFSLGHFFIDLYSAALGTFQPVLGDKLGLSLTQAGILGGLWIGRWYPELEDVVTFCCTEVNDPGAMDELVREVAAEL